jgi:hypothetical protein
VSAYRPVSPSPTSPRLRSPELHPRSLTSNPHVREDRRTPRSKMASSPTSPASHRPRPTQVTCGCTRTRVSPPNPERVYSTSTSPYRGIDGAEESQARTPRCGYWTRKARRVALCVSRAYPTKVGTTGRCAPGRNRIEPSPTTRICIPSPPARYGVRTVSVGLPAAAFSPLLTSSLTSLVLQDMAVGACGVGSDDPNGTCLWVGFNFQTLSSRDMHPTMQ